MSHALTTLTPPAWLDDAASEEFTRILLLRPDLKETDLSLLADYAQACADVAEYTLLVRTQGITIQSPDGTEYYNPAATHLEKRRKQLESHRRDLGLTPKSRGNQGSRHASNLLDALG